MAKDVATATGAGAVCDLGSEMVGHVGQLQIAGPANVGISSGP
jgi:hypothetical protein